MKLTDNELWKLVEETQWVKDHDYERIQQELKKLPAETYAQLEEFIRDKVKELYRKYEKDWLGNPGINASDDSWSDLTAEVVGRGKEFYESISVEKLRNMADEGDYWENFEYSFQ